MSPFFPTFDHSMRRIVCILLLCIPIIVFAQGKKKSTYRVIGFYTAKNDQAHISFVHEANRWFSDMGRKHGFSYDSTNNWDSLNTQFLRQLDVVIFLDTRPEDAQQRQAFEAYMKNGGAWLGFHFAGFALTPSTYPQNWNWYHETFLGSGEYASNTWRPTPAILRNEKRKHPVTAGVPETFKTAPNEWYRWKNDLKKNPDIEILFSIDSSSFPLGTGPKQHEIWREGYYPVVWTNKKYRMVYVNMGHNDIDYENGTNKTLSYSFSSEIQNRLILNCLKWLGAKSKNSLNKKGRS